MTLEKITDQEFINLMKANSKSHEFHIESTKGVIRMVIDLKRRIKRLEAQLDMHLEGHG